MDLLSLARRTIRRYRLAGPDTRVVAALSGGSDSVALVYLLQALDAAGDLRLVGLAHYNHQLRSNADRDERFCEGLASAVGLPILMGRGDVRALARSERRSLEDAARTARHAFLARARVEIGADVVALGHTRDDQAETFLLRLLRGAGAKGLASMHPKADKVIRPLLEIRRGQLVDFLNEGKRSYVTDETNDDTAMTRNRIRGELLPLLVDRFNPSVVDVLANEAEVARAEYWYLDEQAAIWQTKFVERDGFRRFLDADELAAAPLAVSRTVLQQVMTEIAGAWHVGFADVEQVLALARYGGPPFDGPRQRVERDGSKVVLTGRTQGASGRPQKKAESANLFEYALSIPGEVQLAEVGRTLSARVVSAPEAQAALAGPETVLVQLHRGSGPFVVRNRRPGDRFQPSGLGYSKKLQDFFVDRKVARQERDRVPIVVDDCGRIVWVAGHAVDEGFRVKEPAQSVIILRLKGLGGSA